MKFFKISLLNIWLVATLAGLCQASEQFQESNVNISPMRGVVMTPEDEEILKEIEQIQDRTLQLEAVAKKLPHIARATIDENTYELSRFEDYCVGIPADKGFTLEETLCNERKRLEEEVEILTRALSAQ